MKKLFVYNKSTVFSAQTLKELREAGYIPVRVRDRTDVEVVEQDETSWLLDFVMEKLTEGTLTTPSIREAIGFNFLKRQQAARKK